jgi:S1-C subfamily serine protease
MNVRVPRRLGRLNLLRRLHARFVLLALVGVLAIGIGAGLAYAKTRATPIGTGVVVIETNLAYSNSQAAGTGMVLTSAGEVLTNNHVIRGAATIRIVVPATGRSYTARVVGYDLSDDVAVLQATDASNLKTVSIGNSSTVKVGQAVMATGNANGTGTLTSSSGTVTGLAQAITVSDDAGGTERLTGLIETSAALEPGDSGGPLFDAAGKVIAMNTAASVGYGFRQKSGTDGYAIPINAALSIADQIEAGKASATVHIGGTAFLGISVATNSYGYSSGAVVGGVVTGGAADDAGLEAGDVITSIDGHTVSSAASLQAILLTEKPGAKVSVTYLDTAGASEATTVTLASGPPQ